MVAEALHLVRHGEVENPEGVVYGRLPGFGLSERGHVMAQVTADALMGLPVTRLVASPLLRTQQSAAPIARHFGLEIESDGRVIEAGNRFQGRSAVRSLMTSPADWPLVVNPFRPSWGEPFRAIAARMQAAMFDVFESTVSGDAVIVSHQLPIWMVHRAVVGAVLPHDPRRRRCALSSVTTFRMRDGLIVETAYAEPAARLLAEATDRGAT